MTRRLILWIDVRGRENIESRRKSLTDEDRSCGKEKGRLAIVRGQVACR